jgi:phage-related minor tail protein
MAKRSSRLSNLSFADIQAELRRRARRVGTLQRRRDRLAGRIAALDDQIRDLGGSLNRALGRGGGRGRRPRNEQTLPEALHALLKGKQMRVTDAAEAVQKAGYRTSGKTFSAQVNSTLLKYSKLFKRVGRGQYAAR